MLYRMCLTGVCTSSLNSVYLFWTSSGSLLWTSVYLIYKMRPQSSVTLFLFFTAVITNYYTLSGLKQHPCIIIHSESQKSEAGVTGLKPKCRQGRIPSGGSRGESFFLPFPAFRGHPHSLGSWPFCLKGQQRWIKCFSLTLLSLFVPFKGHCDGIGHTCIILTNLFFEGQVNITLVQSAILILFQ